MLDDLKAKAALTYDLLIERYGAVPLKPRRQPMHELISTILMPDMIFLIGSKMTGDLAAIDCLGRTVVIRHTLLDSSQ